MHDMYELEDRLCKELDEYAQKEKYTMTDIEIIDKLTHSLKNINKITEDGGVSGNYAYDDGPMSGRSYRRGRDSMGRFTSRESREGRESMRGGSYADGTSNGKDALITELHKLLGEATVRSDYDAIRRCLSQIQNA